MITFDEIKTLATQLTRADKLRLMDELAAQVGQAVPGDDLAAIPTPTANVEHVITFVVTWIIAGVIGYVMARWGEELLFGKPKTERTKEGGA